MEDTWEKWGNIYHVVLKSIVFDWLGGAVAEKIQSFTDFHEVLLWVV